MTFLTTLALILALPREATAFSWPRWCQPLLASDSRVIEARGIVDALVMRFDEAELKHVTNLYHAERIEIVVLEPNGAAPSARARKVGRDSPRSVIEVRNLTNANESDRQKSEWALAQALFAIELDDRLKSKPPNVSPQRAGGWQANQVKDLVLDVYSILGDLPDLKAEEILPKSDPGRRWLRLLGVFSPPAKKVRPNLRDYNLFWQTGGKEALGPVLVDRYESALIFAERRRAIQRKAVALAAIGIVATGLFYPIYHHAPPPPVSTATEVVPNQVPPEAKRDSDLTPAEREHAIVLYKQAERELEALQRQSSLSNPRVEQIEKKKMEIYELKQRYPFLWMLAPSA